MMANEISVITRRNIADELTLAKKWFHGRLSDPDFLSRIYDLEKLPSKDSRFRNASGDIFQHTVNNFDWDSDWVFYDDRFNLMTCSDEEFLKFLCETIHPMVRNDQDEIDDILDIYNSNLVNDGYQIIQSGDISNKPLYLFQMIGEIATNESTVSEIQEMLDTSYVSSQIERMQKALCVNTDVAIGTAKELIETVCKSIMKKKGVSIEAGWTILRLMKETTKQLEFADERIENQELFEKSLKQLLGGISNIIHSIAELRNAFGSGHGKDADFQQLEYHFAKLIVGVVVEVVAFYLTVDRKNEEGKYKIDNDDHSESLVPKDDEVPF